MSKRSRKITKRGFRFSCDGRDQKHGCFDADFDGVCSVVYWGSRKLYATTALAEAAGKRHESRCQFSGTTRVCKDTRKPRQFRSKPITKHDLANQRETIQDNLLVLLNGLPQAAQTRACQIVVDGFKPLLKKVYG